MTGSQAVPVKPWWQSRTLWFNLAAAVTLALEAQFSVLQPYMPGNVYAWAAVGLTVTNAALRVITVAAISFGKPPSE